MALLKSLIPIIQSEDVVRAAVRENTQQTSDDQLTEEDWHMILDHDLNDPTKSVAVQFTKGDYIIKQGVFYKKIFQIVSGTCIVEKEDPVTNQTSVLNYIHSGATLGEYNFFTGNAASASVVANFRLVEVYLIDKEHLCNLIQSHPQTVYRFYKHLCNVASERVVTHH